MTTTEQPEVQAATDAPESAVVETPTPEPSPEFTGELVPAPATEPEPQVPQVPWYQQPITVKIKVEDPRLGVEFPLPEYHTDGAAAIDLRAMIDKPLVLQPEDRVRVSSGLRVELPPGIGMVIIPRSGLGADKGIVISNLVGLIDSDYRGVVMLTLWNAGDYSFTVEPGDRVLQACFVPTLRAQFDVVDELSDTGRGEGGFGHTGAK